jgi:methionine-rich copper-binding protein CopC
MRARPLALLLLLLAIGAIAPSGVAAHAELEATVPAADSTVEGVLTEVSAAFSEALLEDGSSLSLRDPAGTEVATGRIDPDDPLRLVIDDLPDLAPGEYEARWAAATDDGHLERGTWTFAVVAATTPSNSPTPTPSAAPSATATPTTAPSASLAASPTTAPSPSPSGGDASQSASGSDVILPIVAALAAVAIVGLYLLTRRGRTTPPA